MKNDEIKKAIVKMAMKDFFASKPLWPDDILLHPQLPTLEYLVHKTGQSEYQIHVLGHPMVGPRYFTIKISEMR